MPVVFRSPAESGRGVQGILYYGDEALTIEVEKRRLFTSPQILKLEIPISEIDYVEFRRGPIGARMKVRALYLETTQKIPWRKGIEVDFSFPRKERDEAERLVKTIDQAIVKHQENPANPSPSIQE